MRRSRHKRSTPLALYEGDLEPPRTSPRAGELRWPLGRRRLWRERRQQQEMAVDDRLGDVDQFVAVVLRVLAQHPERSIGVDCVPGHQDPLRLLDQGPAPERALQAVVLGEALQG